MSKSLSLFFATLSVLFMSATAISISHNGWLVALFGLLSLFSIGAGFITKARLRKRKEAAEQAEKE
ncbi:hypothetical protein D3P08_10450 [Paenibacillus nanensis]|uniref:DUF5325 family protein n=1 Tax=Paenibacillus nanensis TaxID=393251 RepID=A0A3A1V6B4_9BACL|nr:DUF5325 family protein [Paenibacillus nanensis]RIX53060.1 hypothetical protein D3P08_10450 [Paenibacillus nanensis]